jgi:hypothetical protein
MSIKGVEHQAFYLESKNGEIKSGLYFLRADRSEVISDGEGCSISRLGKHEFPTLDDFNQALLHASRWAVTDREIVEPPPMPAEEKGEVIVWTKVCSQIPCVLGINKNEAKDIIFSLASTRTSLVK